MECVSHIKVPFKTHNTITLRVAFIDKLPFAENIGQSLLQNDTAVDNKKELLWTYDEMYCL